jgi:hypothetical protein
MKMANHKLFKWFIGFSSVAMFTGFVGLSQKYDQKSVTVATRNSNNNITQNNQHSENIFPDSGTSFNENEQPSSIQGSDRSTNGQDEFSDENNSEFYHSPPSISERDQWTSRDFRSEDSFNGNTDHDRIRSRAS